MEGRAATVMHLETKSKTIVSSLRTITALLCTLLIVFAAVPASLSASAVTTNATAQNTVIAQTTVNVYLRKGPSTSYDYIKLVYGKTNVTVVDRSNASWLKVKLSDGTTGYMSAAYLDILTDCKTTEYLNFRTGPNTSSAIIRTFAPGTKLDILSFSGNSWAKVKASDGKTGYVCTDYVSFTGTSTSGSASSQTTTVMTISEKTHTVAKTRTFTLTTTGNVGKVTWSSSSDSIATVTEDGKVKGIAPGTATITAVDQSTNKMVSCRVTVVKTDYRFIYLSESTKSLEKNQSFTLTTRTEPEGGKYTLTSSDTKVATVSSTGVVKAVSAGKAVIVASDYTGLITSKCTVTVLPDGYITLSDTSISVDAGSSKTISAKKTDPAIQLEWTSSNLKVASVRNGVVSGLSAGSAVITASDATGKITAKCKVTVNAVSSGYVYLSRYSAKTTAGKTIYIRGYNGSKWTTSDSKVATVWDGFIETKNPGKAAISYVNSYGQRAICVVTVTDPAPVKYSYSSPNSATLSSKITLIAITDQKRTGVYFTVNDGYSTTVQATSKTSEGSTYVWKATYIPKKAGVFTVKAYAKYAGEWETCADGTSDVYITSKTDSSQVGLSKLRASDQVIKFIGDKEGYLSDITYDYLAGNLPTFGYGVVVWEGDCFYNHITKGEAFAWLVKTVNSKDFTKSVNSFLINNGLKFNQQQFDALISFSYNCGTGWTSSSDLKNIILNSGNKNLNNVNRSALISEMLSYHHAGGVCYYGLLYRRADELEMFLYNDYAPDGRSNKYRFPNPRCISFP